MNKLIISVILGVSLSSAQAASIGNIAKEIANETLYGVNTPTSLYRAESLCKKAYTSTHKYLIKVTSSINAEGGASLSYMYCMEKAYPSMFGN